METNGFDRFSDNAKRLLSLSQKTAQDMGSGIIETEHLLFAITAHKIGIASDILEGFGADFERLELAYNFMPFENIYNKGMGISQDVKRALETAIVVAKENGHFYVGTEHILYGILSNQGFQAYHLLQNIDVNPETIKKHIINIFKNSPQGNGETGVPDIQSASAKEPKNKDSMLAQYAIDLTAEAEKEVLDPVIGREKEIERIIHILSRRTKNNPVLIGDPGVGKTAIIEGLASKITRGEVPLKLKGKKIYSIDLGSMIAGTKFRGEFEDRLKKLIKEVEKDQNAIIFIDEIHTIIGAGSAEGSLDASNMLKPALSRGKLTCIGATTIEEYRKNIEKDAAFERRFQPVIIEEPSVEDTIRILEGIAKNYEDFHQVVIEKDAINLAAKLSHRYITDRFLPDKAIDLIDEASSAVVIKEKVGESNEVKKMEVKLQGTIDGKNDAIEKQDFELAASLRDQENYLREEIEKLKASQKEIDRDKRVRVSKEDVAKVLSNSTGVPVSKLVSSEKDKFLKLEDILKNKIVGQDEAISAIAQSVKRSRAGISNPRRPIGSFIFLGPTGVGKTELAKVLASEVYERSDALIKIDMSEFMERHNVSRLVGAPAGYVGYDDGGKLTEMVRKKPYSIVLFDEIEKAHPEVFNLLLQILEDGYLTDAKGRKVDFRNTIIIMTSNIGASELTHSAALGFKLDNEDMDKKDSEDYEKMKGVVLEQVKKKFNPEFINRIDKIIVFKPLGKKEIDGIVKINLSELKNRVKKEKGISIDFSKKIVDSISERGYDPEYGARPIRRLIEKEIENNLAEKIISGEIEEGESIKMDMKDGKVVVLNKKEVVGKK